MLESKFSSPDASVCFTQWWAIENKSYLRLNDIYAFVMSHAGLFEHIDINNITYTNINGVDMIIAYNGKNIPDNQYSAISCAVDHLCNVEEEFEVVFEDKEFVLTKATCPCQYGQVTWYSLSRVEEL